jgi:hypothetical protein
MESIRHRCPHCETVSLSPMMSLVHGSSAIWTCESCGTAFDIRTFFKPLDTERMNFVRQINDPDGRSDIEAIQSSDGAEPMQKLVETLGEILFLRDRLLGLEEEAQRLREDLGH